MLILVTLNLGDSMYSVHCGEWVALGYGTWHSQPVNCFLSGRKVNREKLHWQLLPLLMLSFLWIGLAPLQNTAGIKVLDYLVFTMRSRSNCCLWMWIARPMYSLVGAWVDEYVCCNYILCTSHIVYSFCDLVSGSVQWLRKSVNTPPDTAFLINHTAFLIWYTAYYYLDFIGEYLTGRNLGC